MAAQRQVRRHPAAILRVSFEHPTTGERFDATAWDASLGGMFLETSAPLVEGALIALEITTAGAKVAADARVLWTRPTSQGADQPAGMAVRFIDLPDDVSVALTRALQGGMQERTILGIGGAFPTPTAPGAAPGIAPPAAAKPRLVLSDTSLPGTPAAPRTVPKEPALKEPTPKEPAPKEPAPEDAVRARARSTRPSETPLPPIPKSGGAGRLFLLLLIGGAAAAAYIYREPIAQRITPPPAPTPVASVTPAESVIPALPSLPGDAAADAVVPAANAPPIDSTQGDASTHHNDAGVGDAGSRDAGRADAGTRDGGVRDAGHADSGAHGATRPDAGRAPKHP
jgi:uncharacterized protein (TIGR02266 family)